MVDIAAIRKEYALRSLSRKEVLENPLEQFAKWFGEAVVAQVAEPNAMTLSTVNAQGQPTGRIVLLKGIEDGQLVFYTNYNSRKGQELAHHPLAGLTFFWHELERQVRIEGKVEKVAPSVSDTYFQSRPIGSRIGALVSPQSEVIESRDWMDQRLKEVAASLGNSVPERPDHWGGYGLVPHYFEFWQGRPSRLHDRITYKKEGGQWKIERLAP